MSFPSVLGADTIKAILGTAQALVHGIVTTGHICNALIHIMPASDEIKQLRYPLSQLLVLIVS